MSKIQIIAEIGINHNGDLNIAKELIRQAKENGADVVKFQKRNPDVCVPESQKQVIKNTVFGEMSYIDYKHKMEFGKQEYDEIDAYCKEIGIPWTASIWDIDSLNFLLQYDIPFIKIPSAVATHWELLELVNNTQKPVVISNGMTTEDEFNKAINILKDCEVTILICNSSYPAKLNELNLRYMNVLKHKYPECKIGFSGHELDNMGTIVAASMGAEVIERHVTLDHSMKGTDHTSSLEIKDLGSIRELLDTITVIRGEPIKTVYDSEKEIAKKLRYYN